MAYIRKKLFLIHDLDELEDDKMMSLDEKYSHVGYSIYWRLLTYMQKTENCEIKFESLENISKRLLASNYKDVKDVLAFCLEIGLFIKTEDGAAFYSRRLKKNRAEIEERSNAQRERAFKRWQSDGNATAMPRQSDGNANKNKKENKNKNKKESENKKENEQGKRNSGGGKDSLFSSPFATLCKEICDKFGVPKPLPVYYEMLSKELEELAIDGDLEGAAAMVREGLAKLDTAEAIKKGRMTFTIIQFLKTETFLKLYNGVYDKDHSKPRSKAADAGLTFSDIEY